MEAQLLIQADTPVCGSRACVQYFESDTDMLLSCAAASLQLLRNLDTQARAEGGAVWMINGNHESLNVAGDFRCVCVRPLCLLGSCTSHASILGTTMLQSTRCRTVTSIQPLHAIPADGIIMSACRYATEGGLLESAIMGGLRGVDAHLLPNQRAARMRLFAPGGHLAKVGAHRSVSLTSEPATGAICALASGNAAWKAVSVA